MTLFSVAYMLASIHYSETAGNYIYLYSQFPTFAMTYALGTLIARGKDVKVNWLVIAALWIAASMYFSMPTSLFSFTGVIAFSLIYYLVLSNLRSSIFFTNRFSYFLGRLTYPIYLIGLPIQDLLIASMGRNDLIWIPLTVVLTIVFAYFLHITIEKPLIGIGKLIEGRFSPRRQAR